MPRSCSEVLCAMHWEAQKPPCAEPPRVLKPPTRLLGPSQRLDFGSAAGAGEDVQGFHPREQEGFTAHAGDERLSPGSMHRGV